MDALFYIWPRRNRYSVISGCVWLDAVGTVDELSERRHGILAFSFDVVHFAWMVVIVRERMVHVRDILRAVRRCR